MLLCPLFQQLFCVSVPWTAIQTPRIHFPLARCSNQIFVNMSLFSSSKSVFHRLILFLVHTYKWAELQLLRVVTPVLLWQWVKVSDDTGLVFHFTEDGDIYSADKWTPEQEAAALAKCAPKYTSLVHLQVDNKREFCARVTNYWNLGIGETYMEQVWHCPQGDEDVTQFIARITEWGMLDYYFHPWNNFLYYLEFCFMNLQTRSLSSEVIDKHYDLGNDLYESFLDPYMQYTCGYWAKANNLNDAQLDKLELIARKLDLKPGMRVLDIGCGWGMLCKYLAERHGVECVGITISNEQMEYAKKKCKGLNVEIRIQDYRDVNEKFDRMVVVGMLEHVGFRNYDEFFTIARRNLADDGIFLVHTIGLNGGGDPRYDPWLHKYIFPNGSLPFPNDITKVTFGKFFIEDWHNFGMDYVKTLRAWRQNWYANWPRIQHKYDEKFFRMWIYYLTMSAGVFESRHARLWQIVLSKDGLREYRAVR